MYGKLKLAPRCNIAPRIMPRNSVIATPNVRVNRVSVPQVVVNRPVVPRLVINTPQLAVKSGISPQRNMNRPLVIQKPGYGGLLKRTRVQTYVPPLPHRTDPSTTKISTIRDIGKGRILIMIAAGPSVKEVDFTNIKKHPQIDFMCVNKPYEPVWPSKFWVFCDNTQYVRNESFWRDYGGIIINSPNVIAHKPNQIVVQTRAGNGFSRDVVGGYYIGRSSTYANMQVALFMNYDKIYIFGIDMGEVNGSLYHYGQTNPDVSSEKRKERFAAEAEHYTWAGEHVPQEIRDRYIFCSSYNKWPFMKFYTQWDHLTAIDKILVEADARKKT